jgi:hypothetical protein
MPRNRQENTIINTGSPREEREGALPRPLQDLALVRFSQGLPLPRNWQVRTASSTSSPQERKGEGITKTTAGLGLA